MRLKPGLFILIFLVFTVSYSAVSAGAVPPPYPMTSRMRKAINEHDYDAVKRYLADRETLDHYSGDQSILVLAAKNNDLKMVKFLLSLGAHPDPHYQHYDEIPYDKKEPHSYGHDQPLYYAIENKNTEMAKDLLDAGASATSKNISFPDHLDASPIKHALLQRSAPIIELLKEHGARVTVGDVRRAYLSCFHDSDLVCMKFEYSQLPNNKGRSFLNAGEYGITPLTVSALKKQHLEIFEWLMDQGADVNDTGTEGQSILWYAVKHNDLKLAQFAIQKGARKDLIIGYSFDPQSLLQLAVDKNELEMAKLLLADCSVKGDSFFDKTFKKRKCSEVDFSSRRGTGAPLELAAKNRNPEMIRLLLHYNADPNNADYHGLVPANYSIAWHDLESLKILVEAGTQLKGTDGRDDLSRSRVRRNQDSALDDAVKKDNKEILKYLIKLGVSRELLSEHLWDALEPDKSDTEVLQMMLDAGADVNWSDDEYGETRAFREICCMQPEALKLLIRSGLDIGRKTKKGETYLSEAVRTGRADLLDILLENGAVDANVTPLQIAVVRDDGATLNKLLKDSDGADLEELAFLAAEYARLRALSAIIHGGFDVNAVKTHKRTPLTFAVDKKQTKVVDFLLKEGADINLAGKAGSPLGNAVRLEDLKLTTKLMQHGADPLVQYQEYPGADSTTPLYRGYHYCWPCFEIMIQSRYGHKTVTQKDADNVMAALREDALPIMDKALRKRSRLLLRIVSEEIKAHKDELRKDYRYSITGVADQFRIQEPSNRQLGTDFRWQEYVFDTLPFVDAEFIKHESRYKHNNYLSSSLEAITEDRTHFVENLIKEAINRSDAKKAIHLLTVAHKEHRKLNLPVLLNLAHRQGMKDVEKLIAGF